jgi:hypothetical protein
MIRAQVALALLTLIVPAATAQDLGISDAAHSEWGDAGELNQPAHAIADVECYGEYCGQPEMTDCGSDVCCECEPERRCYADVEFMALRPHFSEEVLGKLAEKYEFSPRFVFGVERNPGVGLRLRYWIFDRTTPNLQGGSELGVDFQVTDLEGTHRITFGRTNLTLAGGVRWADIQFEVDDFTSRNDMPGATFATDVHSVICCKNWGEWAGVGGIRWSILGGDWEGSSNGLVAPTRDDNLTVQEIYGGAEYRYHYGRADLYSRLVMEAQNWRSDVLGLSTGVDSISFIGPGLYLGILR